MSLKNLKTYAKDLFVKLWLEEPQEDEEEEFDEEEKKKGWRAIRRGYVLCESK